MKREYEIRPVSMADLPLLGRWRAMAHVRRWWGDPDDGQEIDKLADPRIAMWIAGYDEHPFAFLQDYDVHAWPGHHFGYLPRGSRGIDLYLGEAGMLGQGHGSALLRQHVEQLFARGVPAVGIDPHPDNAIAISCFEKAGFVTRQGAVATEWGPAMLMDCRPA